ncbi:MAG: serine hydrolase domain-containing protein [Arenimonas sp.]
MDKFKFCFVSLLLWCSFASAAELETSEPAKAVFNMWVNALNSGDPVKIQAYLSKYEKDKNVTVESELEFRNITGGFTVLRSTNITPNELHAFLRQRNSDRALLLTIIVDEKNPTNIVKFQLEGTELPEELRVKRMTLPVLLGQARSKLDVLEKSDKISGTLILAQEDKMVFHWTGGDADRDRKLAINQNTKFRIASAGKMFTSVAILQLVEAGKLSLGDSIAKHLPDYPDKSIAERITIRQLLNHTSGLGDIFDDEFAKNAPLLKTHADYVRHYGSKPLAFEPGTQDAYSNFGYIVLGAIIESASGQTYYDYVQQYIFAPAGMISTGAEPESTDVPGRAIAYTNADGKWVAETALPWRGTAAGGCYSTAGDLMKFANALQKGELISASNLEAATSPQNNKHWYGFGFMPEGKGKDRRYGHEGGAPGMNAAVFIYPSKNYVVIGLSNFDPSTMGEMANFIGNRLPL